jgi:hypothetical protein
LRAYRYPLLTDLFGRDAPDRPKDLLGLLKFNSHVFAAVVAELPVAGLREAAAILFHIHSGATPPPLDQRRRRADRAYTGQACSREPDTVQRHLERGVLDPMLAEILLRGRAALAEAGSGASLGVWDCDSWADDLDRASLGVQRQDFRVAGALLARWLNRGDAPPDAQATYLRGRSLWLLGDLRRDRGVVVGPLSAQKSYGSALAAFASLGNSRRSAQMQLALAVTAEMSGDLHEAADRYRRLAADERLSRYDRSRARLWVGTTLAKKTSLAAAAIGEITAAIGEFEVLDEVDDWAVAQQKLALAHLAAGDLDAAVRQIDVALPHRRHDSPLQQVRLDTAYAHVLVSDPATRDHGAEILDRAHRLSARYGLAHQLRSIENLTALARPGAQPGPIPDGGRS